MRVNVHPSGRDQQTIRVDFAMTRTRLATHADDFAIGDCEVTCEARPAGAVDNFAIANYQVVHSSFSSTGS